jgi:CRP/FNR family cyclic AMP-dependent transcriptional regulator
MLNIFKNITLPDHLREMHAMPLFAELSKREMKIVDGFMHDRTYLAGEVVFDAGDEGQALYIILEGKVLVCKQGQPDKPIATLEKRDFFGELALLDDGPRSGQVRASENCTMMVLFRGDFLNLLQSHALIASKITMQLALHLGARLRTALNSDQALL